MVELEFEEIKDKDLPRGFNVNLDRAILQKT
jgi:hypothetical protein